MADLTHRWRMVARASCPGLRVRAAVALVLGMPVAGCSLLVEGALADKGDGTRGGAGGGSGGSNSGSRTPIPTATVGGGGAGGSSQAHTTAGGTSSTGGTGSMTAGSSVSSVSSSSSGATTACVSSCTLANATAACVQGTCVLESCANNFGNCDNVSANGCEASLKSDDQHCGDCATACSGGTTCKGGKCK